MFISEIILCLRDPPSPITCEDTPTTTITPSPTPTTPPPPPPPPITLSSPPPSVTPDLSQPDSVTLSCSVASPATHDYQYQWQWRKNGVLLKDDSRFTITPTTNTQSTSLLISGLQYSDAGEYMCEVEYASCPDGVDCSEATPVTGSITLNLPGMFLYSSRYTVSNVTMCTQRLIFTSLVFLLGLTFIEKTTLTHSPLLFLTLQWLWKWRLIHRQ